MRWLTLLFAICFMVHLVPAASQVDLTHEYTFNSGAAFRYPGGWNVEVQKHGGEKLVYLVGDATKMMLLDAGALAQLEIAGDDLAGMVAALFSPSDDALTFDPDAVEWLELGERKMAVYRYEDVNQLGMHFENLIAAIPFHDGAAGMVHAIPITGHDLEEEALVLQIAASFNAGEAPGEAESTPFPTSESVALSKVYTFKSGAAFAYPRAWEVSVNEDGHVVLEGDRTRALMGDAALLAERELPYATPTTLLEALLAQEKTAPAFDEDSVAVESLGGREVALYEFGGGHLLAAVPFRNEAMGFVRAAPVEDRDVLLRVIATFDDTSAVEVPIEWDGPICTLTSKYVPVNVREIPSTSGEAIRQVETWTDMYAVEQTLGADKFIWFRLLDDGWVRQDTVMFDREACLTLPEGEP